MELHQTQKPVAISKKPYRVVACGRQWGKTTLAVLEMIACAYAKGNREIAYLATTYDQARNIAWAMLKEYSRSIWAKSPNESRLELHIKTQDKGVSRLALRGFENVETARGQQFDFLVIDEVAQMRNWKYNWQAVLEPTLAFRRGQAMFISTPRGFNHFYDLYELGQNPNETDWESWRFTSYDNPFLPKDRIEQARRNSTEDYFAQEYLADFRKATGLAHKQWQRELHLIQPFDVPKEWKRGRGFDYGSAHPTASVRVAVDNDDNYFVEKVYNAIGTKTIKDHAEAIRAQDYEIGQIPSWGDPTGKQWFTEFAQHNLHILPANKEVGQHARGWVEHCIEKVNELLKPLPGHTVYLPDGRKIEDAPRLFVLHTEENLLLVKQIENLKWREKNTGETVPILDEADDPTGGHYDLLAALRYFAVSYRRPQEEFSEPKNDITKKDWRIGV